MAAHASGAVYLHVGLAKSGTTFLQDCLWAHRDELRERGLLYPGRRQTAHFRAAVDLRDAGERWGMDPGRLAGSWDRLAARARSAPGAAVISHEILAACTPTQVQHAADSLGDRELHVVVTARDLGRQVPAHWQEMVKNGSTTSFEEFAAQVVRTAAGDGRSLPFWLGQDLSAVLDRWAGVVPVERVHVLPVQPAGADPLDLWHRFGDTVGVDTRALPAPGGRSNVSLGRVEAALLRDLNAALAGRIQQPSYRFVVKQWFAQQLLPGRQPDRLTVSPRLHAVLTEVAEGFAAEVRRRGYAVHGDLAHLLPGPPVAAGSGNTRPGPDPGHDAAAGTAYGLAVDLLGELLEEVVRLRGQDAEVARLRRRTVELERRPRPSPPPAPAPEPPRRVAAWRRLRARAGRLRARVLARRGAA